jgi:hypothetical protein
MTSSEFAENDPGPLNVEEYFAALPEPHGPAEIRRRASVLRDVARYESFHGAQSFEPAEWIEFLAMLAPCSASDWKRLRTVPFPSPKV